MTTITIAYLPNLNSDEENILKSLSDVGICKFVDNGLTNVYSRIRYVNRGDLISSGFNVWDFSERADEETDAAYQGRLQAEVATTLNILKSGSKDCAFISETGFHQLSQLTEFTDS